MGAATQKLRALLKEPGCRNFPTCWDALSARLTQQAGFPLAFMSGSWVSASRLGSPDMGLISMAEMADQLRYICAAVPGMPILADGDTGYGNAMNVRRTVMEYARAGAAAVMIEDQVEPKRCGHFAGKAVIPRIEARMKIRAAVEAARECDVLIIARTDAPASEGFAAAMDRCRDFVAEGADIVFLEGPGSAEELRVYAQAMPVPTMANMLLGGKSPPVSRRELDEFGVKLAIHHPMIFAAVRAARDALEEMRDDKAPTIPAVTFDEIKRIVGLPDYEAQSLRYKS